MEDSFFEYNPVSGESIIALWKEAVFVFDTNILLNLYRYSKKTSDQFIEIILSLGDRVWLPFQVGLEFNRNRLDAITDQMKVYKTFEQSVNELVKQIENKSRNPFFSEELTIKIIDIKKELKVEIDGMIKSYEETLASDTLLITINDIFNNRIGKNFGPDQLAEIYKEGEKRYKDQTPPGYRDVNKPINLRYGDLIVWKQILQKSIESKVDVIFVLDDNKEDWWLEHQGKTISARPELLREFYNNTKQNIHFYKPFQFLEYSNQYLNSSVKEEIIEEVRNYKEEIIKSGNLILCNLTLRGTKDDIDSLIIEMKGNGYNIFIVSSENDTFQINIVLPNIPDLLRRLTAKYIPKAKEYNIEIIDQQVEILQSVQVI